MPKNRNNRSSPQGDFGWWWILSALFILAYVAVFFSQPSLFGLFSQSGPLSRWADLTLLILWEELFGRMTAEGNLPLGISDRFSIVIAGVAWLAVAGAVGRPWTSRFARHAQWTWIESWAVAILVGLSLLSSLTLCVGLAGGLRSRFPLLAAVAVLFVLSRWLAGREGMRPSEVSGQSGLGQSPLENSWGSLGRLDREQSVVPIRNVLDRWAVHLVPVATIGLVCLLLLGCLMPPWEFDVVEYHLAAPKEFAAAGTIAFSPHNVYANMPLGSEMHSLAMMNLVGGVDGWWWGGLVGKFLTGCFSLLAAAILGGLVSRFCGRWSGWAAAALLLSVPGNEHVTIAGLVDSVLGAYILALVVVLHSATGRHRSPGAWLLIGLLAGAAASTKYTGFVFALAPLTVYLGWAAFRNRGSTSQRARKPRTRKPRTRKPRTRKPRTRKPRTCQR